MYEYNNTHTLLHGAVPLEGFLEFVECPWSASLTVLMLVVAVGCLLDERGTCFEPTEQSHRM